MNYSNHWIFREFITIVLRRFVWLKILLQNFYCVTCSIQKCNTRKLLQIDTTLKDICLGNIWLECKILLSKGKNHKMAVNNDKIEEKWFDTRNFFEHKFLIQQFMFFNKNIIENNLSAKMKKIMHWLKIFYKFLFVLRKISWLLFEQFLFTEIILKIFLQYYQSYISEFRNQYKIVEIVWFQSKGF